MAVPAVSTQFGDLLDPRFQRIFNDRFAQLPDMIPAFYSTANNGRDTIMWSDVGAFADFDQFTGQVSYDSPVQGFDTTATPLEFASGFQVERKLHDDDQYQIMDTRPKGLATAANRTRQKHAARMFNNAFAVDTLFYSQSEGVALCSNTHGTNAASVDTSAGFDNLATAALTAAAVSAARIQHVGLRDDRGNRISIIPDTILIPPDLYEEGFEIVESMGQPGTPNNERNVHLQAYNIIEFNYLTDANNWFMMDSMLMKDSLFWVDRISNEFAFVEDFDTLIAKWRSYMRYANAWVDWRFIIGHEVA
jgi:hypothetical protein